MTRAAGIEALAALLLGLVLVVLGATFTDPGSAQPDLRSSSYVNDPGGLRAMHEVLRSCGLRPERLLEPPETLPDTARTLVVAAPSEPFTEPQLDALFDWVAAGGRLVVIAALPAPPLRGSFHEPLLARVGLRARRRFIASAALSIVPGHGVDADLTLSWATTQVLDDLTPRKEEAPPDETPVPPSNGADARAGAPEPLVVSRSHRLAEIVAFGDAGGEVVVLADDAIAGNEHLREDDNAVFLVQLLTARDGDGGRVVFDEYHHGFRPEGDREGLLSQAVAMLWTTWPGRAVLLVLLAWMVRIAGSAVRLGRPLPDAPPPRRELSEHADALGQLLEKARARSEALRVLAAGTRRLVGPRAGLPATLAPAAFRDRLAASPSPGAAALAEALDQADRLQPSRDADVARAARRLAEARHRYLHGDIDRGT